MLGPPVNADVNPTGMSSLKDAVRKIGTTVARRLHDLPRSEETDLDGLIERLHEEIRRRVKTQGSLPTEDAALVLLFSLVASGQIKLRKIDGWQKIGAVYQHTAVAA